jgi:hypothetical protein
MPNAIPNRQTTTPAINSVRAPMPWKATVPKFWNHQLRFAGGGRTGR